jgi:hypothetical protein
MTAEIIALLYHLYRTMKKITFFFILLFSVYVTIFLLHAKIVGKTAYGDGIFYFSWVRSLSFDRDVDMKNDYVCFGVTATEQPPGTNNRIGNKFSIGPALVWSPSFLVTKTIFGGNGCSLPYQVAVGLTSVLAAITGLIFLYRTLIGFYPQSVSVLSIAGIAFATNMLFYGAVDPVNSHAVSFFAACVLLTALYGSEHISSVIAGAALGLLLATRPQDMLYFLLIIPLYKRMNFYRFFLGFLIMFLPQLLAWQALYGKFWISPYLTGSEGFDFLHPHILGVLFAPSSGLFLWTPVVFIACVGIPILFMKKRGIGIPALIIVAFQLTLIASWSSWWQGASYSGRMFIGTLPLVGFGLSEIFWLIKKRFFQGAFLVRMIVLSLSLLNMLNIIRFLLTN